MIIHGDCLDIMPTLADNSIDLILCDLPYGVTACKWDSIIPIEPLWENYKRLIKANGVIVLFSTQPFTTTLISSNLPMFKYCWYWVKKRGHGFAHSKNKPLTRVEDICVFSTGKINHVGHTTNRMTYYPQGIVENGCRVMSTTSHGNTMGPRPNQVGKTYLAYKNFPTNVLEFKADAKRIHPTQKPVALCEYLIKTYTQEGDTVLDNAAGSGSTGVACINTNRKYILIEKEEKYIEIIKQRIGG
jgi:site-specific DNA-methyltransferase (adenine-specific)